MLLKHRPKALGLRGRRYGERAGEEILVLSQARGGIVEHVLQQLARLRATVGRGFLFEFDSRRQRRGRLPLTQQARGAISAR